MTSKILDARSMFHLLPQCRAAYSNGENVTRLLRELAGAAANDEAIIEIAYDLQAGTYCDAARSDIGRWRSHGSAIAEHLSPHLDSAATLLDCGTGELTTLVGVLDSITQDLDVLAFDISLSRLLVGRQFADEMLGDGHRISCFSATLGAIPLPDSSVDVVTTVHALEPNGGREDQLVAELLRVTKGTLVMFEPHFEHASPDAKARMTAHGYVTDLEGAISRSGGKLLSVTRFEEPMNPLNPTYVLVVEPPDEVGGHPESSVDHGIPGFRCPITRTQLANLEDSYWSEESGIAYPVVRGVPLLRQEHAVLANRIPW